MLSLSTSHHRHADTLRAARHEEIPLDLPASSPARVEEAERCHLLDATSNKQTTNITTDNRQYANSFNRSYANNTQLSDLGNVSINTPTAAQSTSNTWLILGGAAFVVLAFILRPTK